MADEVQTEMFDQALAPEPPVAEPPVEQPAPEPTPPEPAPAEEHVPSWRLREEAESRRTAEQRAQMAEHRLAQIEAHRRQAAAQQGTPDFFDNPQAAVNAAVQAHLQRVIGPIYQENQRTMAYLARGVAVAHHGAEKVDEAERAFLTALKAGQVDPAEYERVVRSPNRYEAAVQWNTRTNVLTSVGSDPKAWFEKELEKQMSDPKFQASLLEKIQSGARSRPAATKVPPSLSRVTAAAGNSEDLGDLSDASLFAHAMQR